MKMHSAYASLGLLLLAAGFVAPVQAQDATEDAVDAAAESAEPMDAADEQVAAEAESGDAETMASDEASGDGEEVAASEDEVSREPGEWRYVYAGLDYSFLSTSLSKDSLKQALGGDDFDSDFYRLRVGTRLFSSIGVEAQFGVKNEDGKAADKVKTSEMYGLYIVPTGNLFRFLEVSAPIGYSHLKLENRNGSVKFDSLSFALNFEIPVYVNPDSRFPDVRIGAGGVVYYAEREARSYSYHAGVRLDFKI